MIDFMLNTNRFDALAFFFPVVPVLILPADSYPLIAFEVGRIIRKTHTPLTAQPDAFRDENFGIDEHKTLCPHDTRRHIHDGNPQSDPDLGRCNPDAVGLAAHGFVQTSDDGSQAGIKNQNLPGTLAQYRFGKASYREGRHIRSKGKRFERLNRGLDLEPFGETGKGPLDFGPGKPPRHIHLEQHGINSARAAAQYFTV